MKNYDKKNESSYIKYLGADNLYVWAMLMMINRRMCTNALDSYTLKQLNHWLKSKNKQDMSKNDAILLNTE